MYILKINHHILSHIFCAALFISYSFCQKKLTNVGFTTGAHGWGMTVQKLFRLNEKSFWGIDGRFYIITGMGDMPTTNYYGLQRERNQKSLVMLPVSFGIQHYPFQGRIANNFYPFIQVKTGPLFVFDGDESIKGFMDRWKKPETQVAYGIQFAGGIKFLVPPHSFMSIIFGYDYFPLTKEADGRNNYHGGVLQLDFSVKIDD